MFDYEESILIAAPREQVFEYLNTPENWPIVMPSVTKIDEIEQLANGGHRFAFIYKLAGISSDAVAEITEFDPVERLVVHIENGMTGDYSFDLAKAGDETRVTLAVDYELTGVFSTHLIKSVATEYNDKQFMTVLRTLKNRVELKAHAPVEPDIRP